MEQELQNIAIGLYQFYGMYGVTTQTAWAFIPKHLRASFPVLQPHLPLSPLPSPLSLLSPLLYLLPSCPPFLSDCPHFLARVTNRVR